MELILILALISGLLGLVSIKRQRRLTRDRFSQRRLKHYNPREDYLEKVKEATKKRFEEEQKDQEYKNNIKKNYLQ